MGKKIKNLIGYLGPAFIISVAYIDPGNFATNISGGSKYNYTLIWVILWSNIMAIFLQFMSAKLGIATGCNLPQMCGKVFSKKTNYFLLVIAELGAIATDLAEFLGAALGINLLFGIPMIYAGIITTILTCIIMYTTKYGQRIVEVIIGFLVGVICISYTIELFLVKPDWILAGTHMLIPSIPNTDALLIAVGMLGATVMPHVIYLHSELVQHRNIQISDSRDEFAIVESSKRKHLRMEAIDISIAMNIAFIVNSAMVIVSAAVFFRNGVVVETIEQAHSSLYPLVDGLSAGAFGLALVASGLSSSAVGTMAGQTIMQGFVGLKISDTITRFITMAPAMLILCLGVNTMNALIISQVILSFVLPFAIIPLMMITARKDLMGNFANRLSTNMLGWIITIIIVSLNCILIYLNFVK